MADQVKLSHDRVIRPSERNDGTWVQIAQRDHHYLDDGTVQVDRWTIYNAGTSFPLADWQSGVIAGDSLDTEVLFQREMLTDTEWAAIEASAAGNGIAPQIFAQTPAAPASTPVDEPPAPVASPPSPLAEALATVATLIEAAIAGRTP